MAGAAWAWLVALALLRATQAALPDEPGVTCLLHKFETPLRSNPDVARRRPEVAVVVPAIDSASFPMTNDDNTPWPPFRKFAYRMQRGFAQFDGATYGRRFAMRLSAQLNIDAPGTLQGKATLVAVTFTLRASPWAELHVDGVSTVKATARSGARKATRFLATGTHDVRIAYWHDSGTKHLELSYAWPGNATEVIPASAFRRPRDCDAACPDRPCTSDIALDSGERVVECYGAGETLERGANRPLLTRRGFTPATCRAPCDVSDLDPWLQSPYRWDAERQVHAGASGARGELASGGSNPDLSGTPPPPPP